MIAAESQGVPRNINNLCFNALSLGCALGWKKIGSAILREVLSDLELDSTEQGSPPSREIAAATSIQPSSYQVTGSGGLVRGTRRVAGHSREERSDNRHRQPSRPKLVPQF